MIMKGQSTRFTFKELSRRTLTDFERLLETHPAPGAYSCWCLYNHHTGPEDWSGTRAEINARNRREKRALVAKGCSHGILVYEKGEPVGWCQFGIADELPRVDNHTGYERRVTGRGKLWRITCFVVPKKYRQRGVASAALRAALAAIRKKGGGIVEAYPITRWGSYADYRGTVSMFRRAGFKVISPFGKNNVVMQKRVRA